MEAVKTLFYFTNCPFHIFRREAVGKTKITSGESKLGGKLMLQSIP